MFNTYRHSSSDSRTPSLELPIFDFDLPSNDDRAFLSQLTAPSNSFDSSILHTLSAPSSHIAAASPALSVIELIISRASSPACSAPDSDLADLAGFDILGLNSATPASSASPSSSPSPSPSPPVWASPAISTTSATPASSIAWESPSPLLSFAPFHSALLPDILPVAPDTYVAPIPFTVPSSSNEPLPTASAADLDALLSSLNSSLLQPPTLPVPTRSRVARRSHSDDTLQRSRSPSSCSSSDVGAREKTWACRTCHTLFFRKHDMLRHERLHEGVKGYSCEGCGRRYARSDGLRRHVKGEPECASAEAAMLAMQVNGGGLVVDGRKRRARSSSFSVEPKEGMDAMMMDWGI